MKFSILISALAGVVEVPVLAHSNFHYADAFVVSNHGLSRGITMTKTLCSDDRKRAPFALWYADPTDTLLDIDASEIREELKSYRISTSEEALAGTDNDTPTSVNEAANTDNGIREMLSSKWKDVASAAKEMVEKYVASAVKEIEDLSSEDNLPPKNEDNDSENTSHTESSKDSRQQRYDNAFKEGGSMSVSTLRQELKDRGISTVSFFDKSDLVKAYANSIADGIESKDSKGPNTVGRNERENYDPSYRDVVVRAFNPRTLLGGDIIIDVV